MDVLAEDVQETEPWAMLFADDLVLTVFRSDDGYAAYEIKEGDEYIGYGDVNDGRKDRRRRLLQSGAGGGS